jgi:hypothetical protein
MHRAPCVLALLVEFGVGCDTGARTPAAPNPASGPAPTLAEPPAQSVAASPAPPASVEPPASAAPIASAEPAGPVPYPEESIDRARAANVKLSCQELVYKRGCAEIRTGHVVARVTLKADGAVDHVEIVQNEIRRDPKVVAKCVSEKLPKWTFDPPGAASPSFDLKLIFSDKC